MPPPDPRHRALTNGFIALFGLGLGVAQLLSVLLVHGHHPVEILATPVWVMFAVFLPATRWTDRDRKCLLPGRRLGFVVRAEPEPAFLIPARRRAAGVAVFAWCLAGWCGMTGIGLAWRDPASVPRTWRILAFQAPALLVAVCAGYLTVVLLLGRPRLLFFRDRLEFHGYFRTAVVPWTAFDTNLTRWTEAPVGSRLSSSFMRFPLRRPELLSSGWPQAGQWFAISHEQLAGSPKFLADAIVEYVVCPQYRAGIGTQAEARRFAEQREALVAAHPSPASVR